MWARELVDSLDTYVSVRPDAQSMTSPRPKPSVNAGGALFRAPIPCGYMYVEKTRRLHGMDRRVCRLRGTVLIICTTSVAVHDSWLFSWGYMLAEARGSAVVWVTNWPIWYLYVCMYIRTKYRCIPLNGNVNTLNDDGRSLKVTPRTPISTNVSNGLTTVTSSHYQI
jgi:hypothetical protein